MAKHQFVVTDESLNTYGLRLMSDGGDFSDFIKNPIMLYSHIRGYERNSGDPLLPIGKWVNLRQEGGRWIAEPEFDEDDQFAMKVSKKVDKGVLNACSISVEPIEWSEDPALMLPGQMLPTITKWKAREISIADLPSNTSCVKLSYKGKSINLDNDSHTVDELKQIFSTNNKPVIENSMKSVIALLNTLITGLSLSDDAKETEVLAGINKLSSKHREEIAAKEAKIVELTAQVQTHKDAAAAAELKATEDKAISLVDNAISAGKILAGAKEQYVSLAKVDYNNTKKVIDSIVPHKSISGSLKGEGGKELSLAEKKAKWDELDKANQLIELKASDPDLYTMLYNAKFKGK